MDITKKAIGCFVGCALAGVIVLLYVAFVEFVSPRFGIGVILEKGITESLLLLLAVSILGLLVAGFVPPCNKVYLVWKNVRFLLKKCDSEVLFVDSFTVLSNQHKLNKNEIEALLVKCVGNGWFEAAEGVVGFLNRHLTRDELETILVVLVKTGCIDYAKYVANVARRDLSQDELEILLAVCIKASDNNNIHNVVDLLERSITMDELNDILAVHVKAGSLHLANYVVGLIRRELNRSELETILSVCDQKRLTNDAEEVRIMIACL